MRVSRRALECKAAGRDIIDLSAGEPDFASPSVAVEAARNALTDGFTRYTAAAGIPDLRAALAARHSRTGASLTAESCLVTVGAKAALFELFQVLVDEDDEVVHPSPAWVSFAEQIRFAGGRPVAVETSPADRFAIHADALIAATGPRTRAFLVNSPSNPTGGVISPAELRRLTAWAASRGVVVIADETYGRLIYDGAEAASVADLFAEYPETVVLVGSFSKTWAMTGWRVGYALGPRSLIAKAAQLQSHMTSNPTSFAMHGALAALEGAEADVERMLAEYAARREDLVTRLAAIPGVRCAPPAGAFYAFPHVAEHFGPGRRDSIELAEYLLDLGVFLDGRLALVPGAAFGADEHLRISFAASREALVEGARRLAAALG